VLLRALLNDDEAQQQVAIETLESAEMVAISAQCFCEFAWVLDRGDKAARADIAAANRRILEMRNVMVNRPAIEAGLRILDAGGEFADGVIAYEGNWLGSETFVSFDRKAVSRVAKQGLEARLLSRPSQSSVSR
jgi:predicted nucleic-acid-binding protein